MRHRVKKIKFKGGYDANRMLIRKLVKNFLVNGYLVTTIKKAKAIKSYLDKLMDKTREKTESNKNYLLKFLGDVKLVKKLFDLISPQLKDISSGYVKIIKQDFRDNDGTLMAKVIWSKPVIYKEIKEEVVKKNKKQENMENKKEKVKNKNSKK